MRPLLLAVLLAAALAGVYFAGRQSAPLRVSVTSTGPTVEQIQELADLIVLRVQVADVLEGVHPEGAQMAVLVRGDCDLVIDLTRAAIAQRDEQQHTARVRLPEPKPVRPRVDHERTRIYNAERTTWIPWRDPRDELYEQVMARAQELVAQASAAPDQIARAKRHAELLITAFYRELGWKVELDWE